jgi:glutamate-1-semialdehyde 2,1-aminomutase
LGTRSPTAGLFFAYPKPQVDFGQANRFVLNEVTEQKDSRMLLLIHPKHSPADIDKYVNSSKVAGFKPYHVYAAGPNTLLAHPGEFIPEWAWQIADQRELVIMLHIVRDRALADEANQKYIVDRCRQYPGAKLILAHAARGFCSAHTIEGIRSLSALENVYFDTSAICESAAIEAVLQTFGASRLMFGTDFPVSELFGRCVSIGDGFAWLNGSNVDWNAIQTGTPTLVGIESILAIQLACQNLRMTDSEIERIFCSNARRLLGM